MQFTVLAALFRLPVLAASASQVPVDATARKQALAMVTRDKNPTKLTITAGAAVARNRQPLRLESDLLRHCH